MALYYITTKQGREYGIKMTTQRVNYGEKEFMLCPKCEKRREKLYYDSNFKNLIFLCRECLPGNFYGDITHSQKGGTRSITYRMNKLAEDIGIIIKFPFFAHDYAFNKPYEMGEDQWQLFLKRMSILENMRWQTLGGECVGVPRKKYDPKLIKYFMQEALNIDISYHELSNLWLDWESLYIEDYVKE